MHWLLKAKNGLDSSYKWRNWDVKIKALQNISNIYWVVRGKGKKSSCDNRRFKLQCVGYWTNIMRSVEFQWVKNTFTSCSRCSVPGVSPMYGVLRWRHIWMSECPFFSDLLWSHSFFFFPEKGVCCFLFVFLIECTGAELARAELTYF